jgi:uncharacterized membrane protein
MRSKTVIIINVILALLVLGFGLLMQPRFPQPMAIHWGPGGQADGYGSTFTGIWLIPIMVIGLSLLFLVIPSIDPLKENIKKFIGEYNLFIFMFAIFMLYIQMLALAYNLDWINNLNPYIMPAMGVFMIFIGQLVSKARRNYFIGIRTPWTLQDERVWDETHKRGGLAFKISGVIALFGILFPSIGMWLLMIPLLITVIYTIALSYFLYRKYHSATN